MAEAIERLEEACALDPEAGDARLLLEELRLQESLEPAGEVGAPPRRRSELASWSHWIAAGVAIGALASLAYLWPNANAETGTGRAAPARQEAPARPKDPPANDALPPGLATRLPLPVATSGANLPASPGESSPGMTAEPRPQSVAIQLREEPVTRTLPIVSSTPRAPETAPPADAPPRAPDNAVPAAATGERQNAQEAGGMAAIPAVTGAAVSLPPPPPPSVPPLERVAVEAEEPKPVTDASPASSTSSPPAALPGAAEASMRAKMNETGEIEETLSRYADAYARLDARAARAVWPTVDQRALARAFEGLESQGIFFEHCDVAVAGVEATAACRGRAQYVPKVGSREPLVQRRQWTFKLHKADAGWQIVHAEAK